MEGRGTAPVCVGVLAMAVSCGSEPTAAPEPVCPAEQRIGSACVGVPASAMCRDASWTEGVTCSSVVEVGAASELTAALAAAGSGTCITLGPGWYGSAELGAGVALLGRGAGCVHVQGVTMAAGDGSVLRGVALGSGGVVVTGAGPARVEAVRVEGSAVDGVQVADGASVEVVQSEIVGSHRYGLSASGPGETTVRESLITRSGGPGAWLTCETEGDPCQCGGKVVLDTVVVRKNSIVGLELESVEATLDNVDVGDQELGAGYQPGGGVEAIRCARVTAKGLRIHDNTNFGLLLDDSDATLGDSNDPGGVEVRGNSIGVAVMHAKDRHIAFEGADIEDNGGVGLFIQSNASRVMLATSAIRRTRKIGVPVLMGGVSAGKSRLATA